MKKLLWSIFSTVFGLIWAVIVWTFTNVYKTQLIASISGSHVDPIVRFFATPFVAVWNLIPQTSPHGKPPDDLAKWFFVGEAFVIEAVWLIGAIAIIAVLMVIAYNRFATNPVRVVIKEDRTPTELIAMEEVSTALALIDQDENGNKLHEIFLAIDQVFEAFLAGVERIFGVQRHEYRYYWLVRSITGYTAISSDRPLDENDKHVISMILDHPNRQRRRFFDMHVRPDEYEQYGVKHVLFVCNEGEFRLAFVLFIYKDGAVTEAAKRRFRDASSMLMLLGHVDKLPNYILVWNQNQQGDGAS